MAREEREFVDDMMRENAEANEKTTCWDNRWAMLGHLIDKGEQDIVLSSMTMSLPSEWEDGRLDRWRH